LKQDSTGKLAVTAQAAVHAWGRWDQPIQHVFATDTSGHGRPYDAGMSGGLVAMHQQPASFLQQLQFNLTTSSASNRFIPAVTNNYIQQIQHLPTVKRENNGDRASYHHNQHRRFVEQQYSQSPTIKAEQQQGRNSPPYTAVPIKAITSLSASSGAEIDFHTEVDTLMKAIQAKSSTAQPWPKVSPVQQTRPVVGTLSSKVRDCEAYS
jgi:hypothetical protein